MVPFQRFLVLMLITQISHFRSAYCTSNFTTSSRVPDNTRNDNSLANGNRRNSGNERKDFATIVPSFSYQFHTNDHEHLNKIVSAHQESNDPVSNGGSASLSGNSGSNKISVAGGVGNLETVSSTSSSAIRRQDTFSSSPYVYRTAPALAPASYAPSHQIQDWRGGFLNNNNEAYGSHVPASAKLVARQTPGVKSALKYLNHNKNISVQGQAAHSGPVSGKTKSTHYPNSSSSRRKQKTRRKILTSRADTYQPYDEADEEEDDENMHDDHNAYMHEHDPYSNDGDDDHENEDDEEHNEQEQQYNYYNQQQQALPPALRDFGQQQGGFGGSGPGPLPPPPAPVKGSIDYILIPLILIGLAGPIFVVLYVVLGSFEFKIAPVIARSLQGSYADYQPYIDTLTSSVGRALEKYECVDYASCKFRGFCSQFDYLLSKDSNNLISYDNIESILSSYTPSEYKDTMKEAMKLLRNGEKDNCEKYKCSSFLGKIPMNF